MKTKLFILFMAIFTIYVGVSHVHDEYCGYDDKTNTGCIYEVSPTNNSNPGY